MDEKKLKALATELAKGPKNEVILTSFPYVDAVDRRNLAQS